MPSENINEALDDSTSEDLSAPRADSPRLGTREVSDKTGISAFTIRYYDKCGFFPQLARNASGVREFRDEDISQLLLVDALRKSGLSIEGIQYFVRLQQRGEESRAELLSIVKTQQTTLEYQLAEYEVSLERLRAAAEDLGGP